MPTDMAHERMRWDCMTVRELHRRLNRITVQEKLDNFIMIASDRGLFELEAAARVRWQDLYPSQEPSVRARRDVSQIEERQNRVLNEMSGAEATEQIRHKNELDLIREVEGGKIQQLNVRKIRFGK